jgi:hypothetical protein
VGVGVFVGASVAEGVGDGVAVVVGPDVAVAVGSGVSVAVGVTVRVAVGVSVWKAFTATLATTVTPGIVVGLAVAVGDGNGTVAVNDRAGSAAGGPAA